jgi:hypothetical protein
VVVHELCKQLEFWDFEGGYAAAGIESLETESLRRQVSSVQITIFVQKVETEAWCTVFDRSGDAFLRNYCVFTHPDSNE